MKIYVVSRGDSLFSIARRFGTTPDDIAYANQLADPNLLAVGQALIIPVDYASHTVRRGQTLYSIARSYDVPVSDILSANPNLGNGSLIYPGQVIRVPFRNESLGEMIVNGYVTHISDRTLAATLPYLTFLSPFSYQTDANGDLTRNFDVNYSLSAAYNTANLLSLTNLKPSGGFSSDIAHAVLTDLGAQNNLIDNLLALLDSGGWYGVNLDFEYVYRFDRGSYNQFVSRLADTLHPLGYILVTALAPKLSDSQTGILYEAHDYAYHGAVADYVVLMTYEWGYTYGPAMAVSPVNMVRRVLDYAVSVMPAGKILMGMPNYGYNWTLPFVQGTAARPLTLARAASLAVNVGAEIKFDETAQAPFFNYFDSDGKQHEVWFEDARSIKAKLELVEEYGLAGVSYWNLNTLFRPTFLVQQSLYSVEKVL